MTPGIITPKYSNSNIAEIVVMTNIIASVFAFLKMIFYPFLISYFNVSFENVIGEEGLYRKMTFHIVNAVIITLILMVNILWLYTANNNLHTLEINGVYFKPVWAIVGWIIPGA